MAKLFISHSSRDKEFVRQLAADLRELGHHVWLDEWEIRVGDCILTKIEEGLSGADFVILVLTEHAVSSGWVEKEWKTKYWEEIQTKSKKILPILLEDCVIPSILQTKKYADFRQNQRKGFAELALAIQPFVETGGSEIELVSSLQTSSTTSQISEILKKVYSAEVPLSQLLAETMTIAHQIGDSDLADFCKKELLGYEKDDVSSPEWRAVQAYCSATAKLNPQHIGYAGNISAAFDDMASDKENFFQRKIHIMCPVPELERRPPTDPRIHISTLELRIGDFVKDAQNPDTPITAYFRADTYSILITAIKAELTKRLLKLLPSTE